MRYNKIIYHYAFSMRGGITSVTLPVGLKSIGSYAFYRCTSLGEIHIPGNVKSIGSYAFYGCTSLASAVLENGVESIGGGAFYGCGALAEIVIPTSVKNVGRSALRGTAYYKNALSAGDGSIYAGSVLIEANDKATGRYDITAGTRYIADGAFVECDKITALGVPASVLGFGESVFDDCDALAEVHITDLAAWCGIEFGEYSSNPLATAGVLYLNGAPMTELSVPEGVTTITPRAFEGCVGITSVYIPASVTSLGKYAFMNCPNIGSLEVAQGNTVYHSHDNCILDTAAKELVVGCKNSVLPTDKSINTIGDGAFYGCTGLTYIKLPTALPISVTRRFTAVSRLRALLSAPI